MMKALVALFIWIVSFFYKVKDRLTDIKIKAILNYQGASYGNNCRFGGYTRVSIYKGGVCKIGNDFRCLSGIRYCVSSNDPSKLVVWPGGKLIIGDNVGISATSFACKGEITVGNNVRIGSGCVIHDTDHHSLNAEARTGANKKEDVAGAIKKPVIIKDNVFIGARCLILKGVVVGENSIIGAGSVVTKNIPDNEIWAGNPAKFIKALK